MTSVVDTAIAASANGNKLFVFGLGFSATRAALAFHKRGFAVAGTSRTRESALQLAAQHPTVFRADDDTVTSSNDNDDAIAQRNVFVFDGTQWDAANNASVEQALAGVTHIIVSVPTGRVAGQEDPVLFALRDQLLAAVQPSLKWLAYLSTIGVYGETNGVAVDESAPVRSTVKRSQLRIVAEQQWLATDLPVHIFRIAGIYGPGRGPLAKVRSGTATRIHLPGRLFNRVHVDDIANVLLASVAAPRTGAIYNVCDDEPAPADDVTAFACELLGVPVVPSQTWAEAATTMSAMAKTFYAESKVVSNARIKRELGVTLQYPTYREGLVAQVLEEEEDGAVSDGPTTSASPSLVVLVNIGSLRPEPFVDLRQLSFRISRALRLPVTPCSFRFSNRIDVSQLHGLAARTFESVLSEYLQTQISNQNKTTTFDIVVLPLFFGVSSTLTDFLPDVVRKCWRSAVGAAATGPDDSLPRQLTLRLGRCLVDTAAPADDRVARILFENVRATTADVSPSTSVSVLVLDHGTPNRAVHDARELVAAQLRQRIAASDSNTDADRPRVTFVGTACMERRDGAAYDFNDPLLADALEHYSLTEANSVVVIALLFLSHGRHAGADGDIDAIVAAVRLKHPQVDVRVTPPLGPHALLSDVLQDRYYAALAQTTPDMVLTADDVDPVKYE